MKKNTRYILITLIVVLVLGGAITALLLTQPAAESEETSSTSSTSSTQTIALIPGEGKEIKPEDVDSIVVENADGGYSMTGKTETVSSSSEESSEEEESTQTTFYIDGVEASLQNTSSIQTAAEYGYSLSASKDVGKADDLKLTDFGLDKPAATITTTLKDGTVYTYSVGNKGPISGYYILYNDEVYVATVSDSVFKTHLDFVNTTVLSITPPENTDESSSSETATNKFTQFVFTGINFPQEVKIVPHTDSLVSSYKLTSPYEVSANNTPMDAITSGVASLTASSVAAVDPTEEQLVEYGLDNPTVRMKFAVNGNSYTLIAGKQDGDNRYVMLDGVDVVYVFANSIVTDWADATLFTLRDSFVWLQNITDVNKLTVKTPEKTDTFTITRTENEESSTEDKVAYDYTVKGTGGKDITYQDIFTGYYQTIIGIQLLDEAPETSTIPDDDPALSITYEYYDGRTPYVVDFYSIGNRRCLAVAQGQIVGVVSETVVQTVIDNTEIVLQNKDVDE